VPPRAVIIPFGVPEDGRGLGLGLAALVHSFARLDGETVALAQLHGKKKDAPEEAGPEPVEAFIAPQTWRDMAGAGQAPNDVSVVVTGSFEPPSEGRGLIQLLAFDAKDGTPRGRAEAHVDGRHAGKAILAALCDLWTTMNAGEIGTVRDIEDLPWEALESVLRAERCVLFDPKKGGPFDRLAAMMHLGRAVEDAPDARFPAGRLAAIALDAAASASDAKLADAARRALARAVVDAPTKIELLEATAALELRLGDPESAVRRLGQARSLDAKRPRTYALLSEARRAKRDLDGALDAVHEGMAHAADDPMLLTERGAVLFERGDLAGAEADWRRALGRAPLFPSAFLSLANSAQKRGDSGACEELVDQVLTATTAHPEVLKKAIHLSLTLEPDGLPRAARLARLASALTDRVPGDAWGSFVLARAKAQLGEKLEAARLLAVAEAAAPGSTLAAEAQRGRFALEHPQDALELESLLRAAYSADTEDLEGLAARGRRLAAEHGIWATYFAVGLVERRRERWLAARGAFESAVAASPGCTPAHLELVAVALATKDAQAALGHAAKATLLEGETPRTLAVTATALLAAGRADDALATVERALTLDPKDDAARRLRERILAGEPAPAGPLARIKDTLSRWLK
jgi:tetratricopeptide (TPR) repeat protein